MTTSEQSRADAMADAETLRRVTANVLGYTSKAAWVYLVPGEWGVLTRQAAEAGLLAVAIHRAEDAARAAFRAVPALSEGATPR